jgi:L-Ala-D/L-Glu epimerase
VGRNPAAKVAISAALHDLVGKRLGVPVWKMWGLDPATAPVSSFTIGIDDAGGDAGEGARGGRPTRS